MSSLSRELYAHHIRGCALPRYGACDRAISRNNAGYIIGQSMRLQLECRRLAGPINRQMSLATQCVCTAASPNLAQGDGCAVVYCVRFARWLLYCTVGLVVYFRRAAGGLWLDTLHAPALIPADAQLSTPPCCHVFMCSSLLCCNNN